MDQRTKQYLLAEALATQSTPLEGAIVHAWLTAHLDELTNADFQKRVGTGLVLSDEYGANVQKIAYHATMRRVDLVGYTDKGAILVEAKDHVDYAALRQVQDYARRWAQRPTTPAVVGLVVAGRTGDPSIVEIGATMGVTVELFPGAAPDRAL